MKRALVALAVFLLSFACFTVSAGAEETDWWGAFEEVLPEGVGEGWDAENVSDRTGIEHLLEILIDGVGGESNHFISLLLTMLGVIVIGSVANLLSQEAGNGWQAGARMAITLGTALTFYHALSEVLNNVNTYLHDVLSFADGLSPVLVGILAGGGGTQTAISSGTNMAGLLLLMEHLCVGVLPSVAGACFAFSLVGSLSEGVQVDGISANLRGIYLTLLGVICTVAAAALRLQTVIGAGRDSVAMQTARFAVGNMIPLAGNTIGATLGTLQTSLGLIKNTLGVSSIVVIFTLTVPVLLEVWGARLAVNLSQAVARLMGFTIGEKLLGDFRGVLDLLLAVTGLVSVTLILYLGVFVSLTLPGGA